MAEKLLQRYGIFLDCANQNAGKKRLRCGGGDVRISCGARDEKACGEKGGGPHIMRGRGRKSLRGEGGRFQKNNYWKNSLKKYLLLFAVVKTKQYFCRLFLRE